jgi:hypothetical protein
MGLSKGMNNAKKTRIVFLLCFAMNANVKVRAAETARLTQMNSVKRMPTVPRRDKFVRIANVRPRAAATARKKAMNNARRMPIVPKVKFALTANARVLVQWKHRRGVRMRMDNAQKPARRMKREGINSVSLRKASVYAGQCSPAVREEFVLKIVRMVRRASKMRKGIVRVNW